MAKRKDKQQGKSVKDQPKRQTASGHQLEISTYFFTFLFFSEPRKKPVAKKKSSGDVDRSVKQQPPKPPPKPQQKKVEVKNKCCIITMVLLTLISLALAVFTGLAAFCQLEEQLSPGYPWIPM